MGRSSFTDFFIGQDMYGHPIEVTYQGKSTFQSKFGAVWSIAMYLLMTVNLVTILLDFRDGSRQSEKVQSTTRDRYGSDSYVLAENDIDFSLVLQHPIPESIGQFVGYQKDGCPVLESNESCVSTGKATRAPLKKCSEDPDRYKKFENFWAPRLGDYMLQWEELALCMGDYEQMELQSDSSDVEFKQLLIEFEYCRDAKPLQECASLEDTKEFMDSLFFSIDVAQKQVLMSEEVIYQDFHLVRFVRDFNKVSIFKFAVNELVDHNDSIGLLPIEPQTRTFLSFEEFDSSRVPESYLRQDGLPLSSMTFELSQKDYTYERQVYTVMQLIGDVGGFNSAIVIFPSLFVSYYNAQLFKWQISRSLTYRKPSEKKSTSPSHGLQRASYLTQLDIANIFKSLRLNTNFTFSFYRSLFCRQKQAKLRDKALKRFDKSLDIRSFANDQTNLALLVDLLFTKEQTALFMSHVKRPFQDHSSEADSSSEELPGIYRRRREEDIVNLLGYQLKTALDKKLLEGVLDETPDPSDHQQQVSGPPQTSRASDQGPVASDLQRRADTLLSQLKSEESKRQARSPYENVP